CSGRRPRHGSAHGVRIAQDAGRRSGARADRGLRALQHGGGDGVERARVGRRRRSDTADPRPARTGRPRGGGNRQSKEGGELMSWWQWVLIVLLGGVLILVLTQIRSLVRYIRIRQL